MKDEMRLNVFGLVQATYWNDLPLSENLLMQVDESL